MTAHAAQIGDRVRPACPVNWPSHKGEGVVIACVGLWSGTGSYDVALDDGRVCTTTEVRCLDVDCVDCYPIDGPAVPLEVPLADHHVGASS